MTSREDRSAFFIACTNSNHFHTPEVQTIYYAHLIYTYSYIKFLYRQTFLFYFVRLHFHHKLHDKRRVILLSVTAMCPISVPHSLSPSKIEKQRLPGPGTRPTLFQKAHGVQGTDPRDAATAMRNSQGEEPPPAPERVLCLNQPRGCRKKLRGTGSVLCEDMRSGGNGHKLTQDVLGHLYIVLCNHQSFLDVLLRVSLTHEELDLTADLSAGFAPDRGRDRGGDRAGAALRVDPSG